MKAGHQYGSLLSPSVRRWLPELTVGEKALLADLHKNGVEYELMAQMPLPKRERKPKAQPATPVDMAASKVRQWERKLRMAENKLKKYQRRLKRLQKKGAVAQ